MDGRSERRDEMEVIGSEGVVGADINNKEHRRGSRTRSKGLDYREGIKKVRL